MADLMLKIFPCKANKAPKVPHWKDTTEEISLKDLITSEKLPYENCAVIVPNGLCVYDFDCPKDINPSDYKEKVFASLPKCSNLLVETDKGIHIWTKGNVNQTAKKRNYLGFLFDTRTNGKGYVVVQLNGVKREMIGDANHYSWKHIHYEGANEVSLNKEEKELFNGVLAGKDFEGQRNDIMFRVYKMFLIEKLGIKNQQKMLAMGKNFNNMWDWKMDDSEINTIMRQTEKEKEGKIHRKKKNSSKVNYELLFDDEDWEYINQYPFVITVYESQDMSSDKPYFLDLRKKPNSQLMIHFERAIKMFNEEHKDRLKRIGKNFFIVEENGVWNGSEEFQENLLRDWLEEKGGLVSKGDIEALLIELKRSAKVVSDTIEKAYLINGDKVLYEDCKVAKFNPEKHQVMCRLDIDLIKEEKVDMKRVNKFIEFIDTMIKYPNERKWVLAHCRYVLMPTLKAKKMFLLQGQKNSGKSTFCGIIRQGLGEDKVKTIQIGTLFNERFGTSEMVGTAMVNDDDVAGYFERANLGQFKSIISNESISVEFKFDNRYNEKTCSKIWACSNDTLTVQNREGVDSRIHIIETKQIKKEDRVHFIHKQFNKMDYHHFFSWLIYKKEYDLFFLDTDLKNWAKFDFLTTNNSVFQFASENDRYEWNYANYITWAKTNGFRNQFNSNTFGKEIKRWEIEYYKDFLELKKNKK